METFASIYIGSYEISMKIFELSVKKGIHEVDCIRHRMELGRDVYSTGSIGAAGVEELCQVLSEFAGIMNGYRVKDYRACAGMAMRDAGNEAFILDQIRMRTGLTVTVLSNSEHRFLSYKAVASKDTFEEMTGEEAAVVDIGGGSLQITLFVKGQVITTQHMLIGTLRIRDRLSELGMQAGHYAQQVRELVDKELEVFKELYLPREGVKNLILMGDYVVDVMRALHKNERKLQVDGARFAEYAGKLSGQNLEMIAEELDLANERDPLIVPSLVLFQRAVQALGAEQVYVPGMDANDGIAYDYAQKHNMVKATHDFSQDVLSAARHLASRYFGYEPHIRALEQTAVTLFDAMKKRHGLTKRERLLLQTAAILHDCGKYISLVNAPGCSYDIIMASEIIGLTHLEREIVASTVLYNTRQLEPYEQVADKMDAGSYITVAKLAAILRVANALDKSHKQKMQSLKASLTGGSLVITLEVAEDVWLERGMFETKAAMFEEVFSTRAVIKVKKISR